MDNYSRGLFDGVFEETTYSLVVSIWDMGKSIIRWIKPLSQAAIPCDCGAHRPANPTYYPDPLVGAGIGPGTLLYHSPAMG